MRQGHRDLNTSNEALLITLYKSVSSEVALPPRRDFVVWGPSNFLYVDPIRSISDLALLGTNLIDAKSDPVLLTEKRYLCLYENLELESFSGGNLNWIFDSQLDDYPLLVITLLQSTDIPSVIDTVKKRARLRKFRFDVFHTLGHSKGALVIRCRNYTHALECVVELNTLNENTYSIAAVQNPLVSAQLEIKEGVLLFPQLLEANDSLSEVSKCAVSISFRLKQSAEIHDRVSEILSEIESMTRKVAIEFSLSNDKLRESYYFELGRYDIELRLEGAIAYVLELLLSPKYGLANKYGDFCTRYISESRTVWKALPGTDRDLK